MLGAFLTDRTPLTAARIQKRIHAGAPIYGTSPDRPIGPVRRIPYMTPEAYATAVSMHPRLQAGAPERQALPPGFVQDTGAIYQQAQALLVAWRKGGGPISPPSFGDDATDLGGDATPRTVQAIASFQQWTDATGGDLRTDGVLDQATLGNLVIVTAPMVKAAKAGPKSMWPWWLVGVGALGAVLYSEYGTKRSR